jgi:general stress protein 26
VVPFRHAKKYTRVFFKILSGCSRVSNELVDRATKLLASQSLGVLGTSDHGHPYTSLVVFSEAADLSHIVFFTRKDRQKFKNLKSDSRVSIYVDSRERWQRDPTTIEGLSITGVAWEVRRGGEFDDLRRLYLEKNPHMTAFADDPDSGMFKINVETCKYVVNFDEAHEFNL